MSLRIQPPEPVPDGHLPVPDWLQKRAVRQFSPEASPYEYSLYGVTNALLSTQFPLDRKFMIKPQGGLRGTLFELGPGGSKTSGGSSSSAVPIVADFIVCKANEALHKDYIVAIIEMKKEDTTRDGAESQLIRYLSRAKNESCKLGRVYGFLVVGHQWTAYSVDTTHINFQPEADDSVGGGVTHEVELKQALFNISRKYWGEVDAIEWAKNDFVGPFER